MSGSDDAAAQHVQRTLRALEALAEGPQSQADLARRLGVHRRTTRRLLARLVAEGYAEPTSPGRHVAYTATSRLVVLGRQVANGLDLHAIGRRHLATLNAESHMTFLAFPGGEGTRPLHATAAGKVLLSMDTTMLDRALSQELLAFTDNTIVTRADLLLELATVRERGYAIEDAEYRPGVRAAAAGVTSYTGRIAAALGATAPPDGDLHELGRSLRYAAINFSREIGGVSDSVT